MLQVLNHKYTFARTTTKGYYVKYYIFSFIHFRKQLHLLHIRNYNSIKTLDETLLSLI
jgi:hypothetical protein